MPENFGTLEVAEGCVCWSVPGFADLSEVCYDSPVFSLGAVGGGGRGIVWMWPNGWGPENEGYVSVGLWCPGGAVLRPTLRYQVSLFKDGHLTHTSQPTPGDEREDQLIQRSEVLNESGFLSNGQLEFHLKIWQEDTAEPVCSHQTQQSSLPTNDPRSFFFQRWYQDTNCTDITVKVHDKEFRVHKFVLASRSRVFYAMFSQDMSESNTNSLDVTDLTSEGFEHLLEYMYTGNVADMERFAAELLHAAEKYELDELKAMCVASLRKTISEHNVLNTFALADLHRDPMLKNAALEFIKHHSRSVTASEEWKTFLRQHPELVTEINLFLAPTEDLVGDDPPTKKSKIN